VSGTIRLAHSPDPDDAFMFYALTHGLIDSEGIEFEIGADDVESLNRRGLDDPLLDLSALSVAVLPALAERYKILDSGASLGEGCGPVVVAREPLPVAGLRRTRIAIPGFQTSAWLALRLALGATPPAEHRPFDTILDAVAAGEFDAGLVIHEGQLTYADHGLTRVIDLGEWWQADTGLPLPLGVNAIRRGLDPAREAAVARVVGRSIRYGLEHRAEALEHARGFGRGIDSERADRFVGMYVNELTVSLGERGRRAIETFLERGHRAGLVPDPSGVEIVG